MGCARVNLSFERVDEHRLHFKRPFLQEGQWLDGKDIAVLRVTDEQGHSFAGEIGPFPGVHCESLETVLKDVFPQIWPLEPYSTWDWCAPNFGQIKSKSFSCLQSCWEQILFQKFLRDSEFQGSSKVALSGLLTLKEGTYLSDLKYLQDQGFLSIKIKLGRDSFSNELEALKNICRYREESVYLRLDANQGLSRPCLDQLWSIVQGHCEYFEEPLPDLVSNLNLPYPIALDESLWNGWKDFPLTPYFIVKPMRLGFSGVYRLLAAGVPKHRIVLSSCFDSGIATRTYLDFITYHELTASHGFGPYSRIKHDILDSPLDLESGHTVWSIL